MSIERIISGGQTGVDSAALRLGLKCGIPIGGTVPRGFAREDGTIPEVYRPHLTEGDTASPARRTAQNVNDADATLILHTGELEGGTRLTIDFCRERATPHLVADLDGSRAIATVTEWLVGLAGPTVLNVAGPRESERPGIARRAYDFLEQTILPVRDLDRAGEREIRERLADLLGQFFANARRSMPVVDETHVDAIERDVRDLVATMPDILELRAAVLRDPRGAAVAFRDRDSRLATLLATIPASTGAREDPLTQARLF